MGLSTTSKYVDIEALTAQVALLVEQNKELQHENDWLKRQLFGPKSEKRVEPNPHQMSLGEEFKGPGVSLQRTAGFPQATQSAKFKKHR